MKTDEVDISDSDSERSSGSASQTDDSMDEGGCSSMDGDVDDVVEGGGIAAGLLELQEPDHDAAMEEALNQPVDLDAEGEEYVRKPERVEDGKLSRAFKEASGWILSHITDKKTKDGVKADFKELEADTDIDDSDPFAPATPSTDKWTFANERMHEILVQFLDEFRRIAATDSTLKECYLVVPSGKLTANIICL